MIKNSCGEDTTFFFLSSVWLLCACLLLLRSFQGVVWFCVVWVFATWDWSYLMMMERNRWIWSTGVRTFGGGATEDVLCGSRRWGGLTYNTMRSIVHANPTMSNRERGCREPRHIRTVQYSTHGYEHEVAIEGCEGSLARALADFAAWDFFVRVWWHWCAIFGLDWIGFGVEVHYWLGDGYFGELGSRWGCVSEHLFPVGFFVQEERITKLTIIVLWLCGSSLQYHTLSLSLSWVGTKQYEYILSIESVPLIIRMY